MEIRMFMWQWQHTFQSAVAFLIESIFQILELQITSNTFIIGIPINARDTDKIFFQKEDCGFIPNDFKNVFSLAKDNFDKDPEHNLLMTAAHLNKAHKESLEPKSVRNAVQFILKSHDLKREQVSFCSFPIKKNEHWVMTVIQLNQQDFNNQYRLTKEIHEVHSMRKFRINRCFLEAIIDRILTESQLELERSSEGQFRDFADSERVIEDAASSLLSSIKLHIDDYVGADLFNFANAIAAERYEGEGSKGRLVISPIDHKDVSVKIKLKVPIDMSNFRGIRKLLEVSSNELALLCDTHNIWGLGIPLKTYKPSSTPR